MGMVTAERAVQNRIEAEQVVEAIKYGQRAMAEMGGARGCTAEYAGADWAIAQYNAAVTVAEYLVGVEIRQAGAFDCNAAWIFKRAAKIAREQVAAAKAEARAIGTARQLRMAMAA